MLGDILFSTQRFVIHLVTTFSVGDHYDSHGRYAVLASGADMIWFQPQCVMTMSVPFCTPDHSKKKVMR